MTIDDVLALRPLPHVIAVDGGHQYVSPFRVGDVDAKYNGDKLRGPSCGETRPRSRSRI